MGTSTNAPLLRSAIVNTARQTLDTTWRHQGRLPGLGIDCLGVVIWTGRELGALPPDFDVSGYGREPKGNVLADGLKQHLDVLCSVLEDVDGCGCGKKHKHAEMDRARQGDILQMRMGREACHVAVYTESDTIIHASDRIRVCKEHRMDDKLRKQVVAIYRWPGVTDG